MELGPLQTQWLEALESGKYKQGIGKLHTADNSFCCLGVACKLFSKNPPVLSNTVMGKVYKYEDEINYLPPTLVEKLKLFSSNGTNIGDNRCLSIYNDEGASFLEIAQKVRANPSHFFREPA